MNYSPRGAGVDWRVGRLAALAVLLWHTAQAAPVDFRRDVEPIFVKRCSECHGPDMQKGKLRLDHKSDALRGGKSGKPLLIPGKSAESELIARVTATDPDDVMPAKGERLTEEQIATLRRWIEEGATWPDADIRAHWSLSSRFGPKVLQLSVPTGSEMRSIGLSWRGLKRKG